MTTSNRDVTLGISVETGDTSGVTDLAAKLRDMSKAGGDAAPKFLALADQLEQATADSKRFADAERASVADVAATRTALQAKKDALALLNIQTDAATRQTDEYKTKVQASRLEILNESIALRGKREALAQSATAATQAATAERTLAQSATAAMTATKTGAGEAAAALGKVDAVAGGLTEVFTKLAPIMAAAFSGRQFVDAIVQTEQLQRGFTAIQGSGEAAGQTMAYLKDLSNRMGLEVQGTSKAFLELTAATKGTQIEGDKTRALFEALSRAGSTLGKTGPEMEHVFLAVSQMAAKGTVSMEEFRRQLGEALPGSMKAAADGAGVTEAQLIKMIESGQVLASDLLPALTKGLDALYTSAPPTNIISNWNRFTNAVTAASVAIGEGGAGKGLADTAGLGAVAVTQLSEGMGLASGAIADLALAIRNGTTDEFQFSQRLKESKERIADVAKAAGFAVPEVEKLGTAANTAGESVEAGFRKSEIAARNASGAVVDGALKQQAAYETARTAADRSVDAAVKGAAAADQQAKTIGLLASAFGNETDKLQANALATGLQRDATAKLSEARKADLSIAEQRLVQLKKEVEGMAAIPPATALIIKDLEASIAVKVQEVKASEAKASADQIAVAAAKTASEAYKDNSARLGELKDAADNAARALATLQQQQAQGKATADQVSAATLKAAQAQALYRDALRDTVTAAEVHEKTIARAAASAGRENDLAMENARTVLAVAQARHDDVTAQEAQIAITNIGINTSRQAAQAQRDEATAMRTKATAIEREAAAAGTLNTAKKDEIAALRDAADAKDQDAKKSDLLADREVALAQATAASTDAIVDSLERRVTAQEKLNDVLERADALERKRKGVDKSGFATDANGNRIVMGNELGTRTGIYNFLKSAGVDDDAAARQITSQFADEHGNIPYMSNPGQARYGGDTMSMAVSKAAETYLFGPGAQKKAGAPGSPGTGAGQTVTISINGKKTPINMASSGDANTLTAVLKQLESAANAAS